MPYAIIHEVLITPIADKIRCAVPLNGCYFPTISMPWVWKWRQIQSLGEANDRVPDIFMNLCYLISIPLLGIQSPLHLHWVLLFLKGLCSLTTCNHKNLLSLLPTSHLSILFQQPIVWILLKPSGGDFAHGNSARK